MFRTSIINEFSKELIRQYNTQAKSTFTLVKKKKSVIILGNLITALRFQSIKYSYISPLLKSTISSLILYKPYLQNQTNDS